MSEDNRINLSANVDLEHKGKRLDVVLAVLFPEYSREKLKQWVKKGECLVNGKVCKPKDKVSGGEEIVISATKETIVSWESEKINANIEYVHEDEDIIIINKPANLVVHPGAGNLRGTLANILLEHSPCLHEIPRAGIVHRLDKDTTGLMVVAKTLIAHASLVAQLQNRTVKRTYDAIVWGLKTAGGKVDLPIGRHGRDRIKMAVRDDGKEAVTHYRITEKFRNNMHLKVILETGRTHQIRVHMSHLRHPLVGDKVYGRSRTLRLASEELKEKLQNFPRQALHASELELTHPTTKKIMKWPVNLPQDMQELLNFLREDMKLHV